MAHHEVARGCQPASPGQHTSVDHGDDRFRQAAHGLEHRAQAGGVGRVLVGAPVGGGQQFGQVGSRAKILARAAHRHDPDGGVEIRPLEPSVQGIDHGGVHGIALVRAVQGQRENAVRQVRQQRLSRHRGLPGP